MSSPHTGRQIELRAVVGAFLKERLDDKLDKPSSGDPKHLELRQRFDAATWLDDAARRVGQLQAVTHSVKPAKGTSLRVAAVELPPLAVVGTHCLGVEVDMDVVGNAAALDVYKFLKVEHDGRTLLSLCEAGDADLAAALSDDPAKAAAWMSAFAGLTAPRGKAASHTNAKQLYWLVGSDPNDDAAYHLLAPLYPTSLIHRVYATVQDHRFGDGAKLARKARREGAHSADPVHEYTDLAIQKLGGAKPQNISQLNFERRGNNLLLASLPPTWRSLEIRPLLGVSTLFERFGARRPAREPALQLRRFLESDPPPTQPTRLRVTDWVNTLIDELLYFTAELRALEPGWSQVPECRLCHAHKHWLDPWAPAVNGDVRPSADDTAKIVAGDFANWLNSRLRKPLEVGDAEFLRWRKLALDQINGDDWELRDDE